MRNIWTDHVVWTHDYLISAIEELHNKDLVTERLLQNQTDIGNTIISFYGKEAGTALTKLLREHILISADVVKAAIDDDTEKPKVADTKGMTMPYLNAPSR